MCSYKMYWDIILEKVGEKFKAFIGVYLADKVSISVGVFILNIDVVGLFGKYWVCIYRVGSE